jgi:hypothetical protein
MMRYMVHASCRVTYCQNKFVSSSRKASTPQPGLYVETVQEARLPISFKPVASKGGSTSMGTRWPYRLACVPELEVGLFCRHWLSGLSSCNLQTARPIVWIWSAVKDKKSVVICQSAYGD